ncbi:uncharacterized protein LOC131429197 [Malaya genurostris]|uniref:uncharacterized protein LOC131429197 n=1 Tax=Malaya genurostris TaxID=325434 RepID=UPI0026F3AAC6|nr:uncharacterized protein LOC131429197 [Malaya genurostris]
MEPHRDALKLIFWKLSNPPPQSCHSSQRSPVVLVLCVGVVKESSKCLISANVRTMEAPDTFPTVELLQPAVISRPGPVSGNAEGVFQTISDGKYNSVSNDSGVDSLPVVCSYPSHDQSSQPLHLYYQNVGGMNMHITDYLLACSDDCFDIIALSETWLSDCTLSVQGFGSNYEVFRTDRSPLNNSKTIGGGVLIAVHRRLKAQLIETASGKCVEQVWVRLKLVNFSLYLCVIYLPPDRCRDLPLIDAHIQSLQEITSTHVLPVDEILIVGDFNFSSIKWQTSSGGFFFPDPALSTFHIGITTMLDGYNLNLLRQSNPVVNENNRMLDLCFSSREDVAPKISASPFPLVNSVRHHPPLHIVLDSNRLQNACIPTDIICYNFSRTDYTNMTDFLTQIDWDEVLDNDDVNAAVQTFSNVMSYAIDYYVPKRSRRQTRHPPWLTAEARHLKTTKRAALKRYSKHGGFSLRNHYVQINQLYKKTVKRCHANYLNNQQIAAAALNVPLSNNSLNCINIDEDSIRTAIVGMKASNSPGPDGIPAVILKKCSRGVIAPLCKLFRMSLATEVFPNLWKASFMFPVHKKGDKKDINNYRGITSLSAIPKLFEKVDFDGAKTSVQHKL